MVPNNNTNIWVDMKNKQKQQRCEQKIWNRPNLVGQTVNSNEKQRNGAKL